MRLPRLVGIYLVVIGLGFISIGVIGTSQEPIKTSLIMEFEHLAYYDSVRILSISSGVVEINVISEGPLTLSIYRSVMGFGLEEVAREFIRGYKKFRFEVYLPTDIYFHMFLGGVNLSGAEDGEPPKLLIDVAAYPNNNYTLVLGGLFTGIGGLMVYYRELFIWIRNILRIAR
ncbi:MAG TPA: hypothetical protein EYH44_04785 [Thermoprotei archaeon]|nr:hypothetical protein [Thermoprotei archaeon]